MLTTALEVVKNRDVLIKLARHALALERREVRRLHRLKRYAPAAGRARAPRGLDDDARRGRSADVVRLADGVMRAANGRMAMHKELVQESDRWAPIVPERGGKHG